jgi:hypothetical protein
MPRFNENDEMGEGVAEGSGLCVGVAGIEVPVGANVGVIDSRSDTVEAGAQAVSTPRRNIERTRFIKGLYS